MKSILLEKIDKEIEEVVTQYRENPSEKLYQKWLDLLRQYSQQHDQQRTIRQV